MEKENPITISNALKIAIIIALMALALNQMTNYYYKNDLLKSPCENCLKANPTLELCYKINNEKNNNLNYFNLSVEVMK